MLKNSIFLQQTKYKRFYSNHFRFLREKKQKKPPLSDFDMHLLVPKAGLEPARISTVDFESTASTDFATSALKGMRKRCGLYLSRAAMQATTR